MKQNLIKKIALLSLVCFTILLTGCGKTSLKTIKQKGTIVLGTCADYPPYEFHKKIDGKDTIVGFDIEISKKIAEKIGVNLEIKDMDFNGLLSALNSGKVDFVLAGMNPTPKRAKSVDFSKIYYTSHQSIVVKKGTKDKYKSLDDFSGMTIGAQKGTIQQDIAESIPDAQVKLLSKVTDLVLALNADKVDAIIVEKPVAKSYVKTNENIEICDIDITPEDAQGTAVAVKKGSKELVDLINEVIDELNNEGKINEFFINANKLAEQN